VGGHLDETMLVCVASLVLTAFIAWAAYMTPPIETASPARRPI
jgi:hypothetical protein